MKVIGLAHKDKIIREPTVITLDLTPVEAAFLLHISELHYPKLAAALRPVLEPREISHVGEAVSLSAAASHVGAAMEVFHRISESHPVPARDEDEA